MQIASTKPEDRQFVPAVSRNFRERIKTCVISLASYKLRAASQTIKIELKVQEPIPLVRTKSAINSGETRDVTAKFTMDWAEPEKANQVGCLDKLVANASPKFDMSESPSLEGKTVEWILACRGRCRYSATTPLS